MGFADHTVAVRFNVERRFVNKCGRRRPWRDFARCPVQSACGWCEGFCLGFYHQGFSFGSRVATTVPTPLAPMWVTIVIVDHFMCNPVCYCEFSMSVDVVFRALAFGARCHFVRGRCCGFSGPHLFGVVAMPSVYVLLAISFGISLFPCWLALVIFAPAFWARCHFFSGHCFWDLGRDGCDCDIVVGDYRGGRARGFWGCRLVIVGYE